MIPLVASLGAPLPRQVEFCFAKHLSQRECVGLVCGQVKASKYALCKSEMYTQKERKRERESKRVRQQGSNGVREYETKRPRECQRV